MLDKFFQGKDSQRVRLSLDRCTMLIYSPYLAGFNRDNVFFISRFNDLLKRQLAEVLDPDFLQGHPTELFLHHYRTVDGVDIQFGSRMPKRLKVTDQIKLDAYGSDSDKENGFMFEFKPNDYAFRVEWNPNKENLHEIFDLLSSFQKMKITLSDIRIARLDIAIDFPGSICPPLVLCNGMRKSFIAMGTNGIESVYFGTRNSPNYFRLYNKRQEILDQEGEDIGFDLWRLELQSRVAFRLSDTPDYEKQFDRFTFQDGARSTGDWELDLIRIVACQSGLTSVLRMMPLATSARYRKIFRDLSIHLDPSPVDVYRRDFPRVWHDFRLYLINSFGFELLEGCNVG